MTPVPFSRVDDVSASASPSSPGDSGPAYRTVSWAESFRTWCRVAALSFGGPAGQIAVMHRIIVDEKKWLNEERFLHALNYCMLLPGPEAQQLATYIGWLMHGTRGGLMAGTLFILPGFVAILVLSVLYAQFKQTAFLDSLLFGLKAAVLAVVVEAVLRIGRRVLKNRVLVALAVAAFIGIFFFGLPFPVIILAAALAGFIGGHLAPDKFAPVKHGGGAKSAAGGKDAGPTGAETEQREPPPLKLHDNPPPTWGRALRVSSVCLTLWFGPLLLVYATLGRDSVLAREGEFFSQMAVVTFGGAYSVLSYVAQQAVETHHWLQPREMLDGLGMAETTPGPLIMVVQFVGFLGAYRAPSPFSPLVAGLLGSVLTTWVTFVPCFYWIFLGAPYVERLRGNRLLNASLTAITAAVTGVVLNLAVWFSLHTLFAHVHEWRPLGLRLLVPEWSTLQPAACLLAVVALLLTFVARRGLATTLLICCGLGIAIRYVGVWFGS